MAHIDHFRRVDQISRLSLRDAISPNLKSFAAFGGASLQRYRVGIQEMALFCDNMGIVVLHNDPQIEIEMRSIFGMRPDLINSANHFQMSIANQANNAFYDPFYGLGESAVLDALVPIQPHSAHTAENQSLRTILSDYLSIINYQFKSNSTPFGMFPYNLDLLLEITSMPYSQLQTRVLNHLPQTLKEELSGRLSADGAQQKAYSAVSSFSQTLSSFLWKRRGFANHSRLSIISTIMNRDLISIYVPDSRADVLNYVALELQQLNIYQIPYLLVESGIALNNSNKLKDIFLSEHGSLPYYTGILAENTSSVISPETSDSNLADLFSQTQEMFVFQCASTYTAQPFSEGIGNYLRLVEEHHQDSHREPFHLFQSHAHGSAQREHLQRSVTPEELTGLGVGCLLYGKNYPLPVLVNNLIL